MTGDQSYLLVREVATLVRRSERTVRRWIADGTLPSVKIGGTRLVAIAELQRLLSGGSIDEDGKE
jgi:excisionase family DNA binding protein